MKPNDLAPCNAATSGRCDAELPDNPQCAPNYHFGMLLGVEDLRAEQGFHLGRSRRHQRLLHGSGVVAGYAVDLHGEEGDEIRVGPGLAVDGHGRDVVLEREQCVSLPRWWQAHRTDAAFHDIGNPEDATFDLDVLLCHASCLDRPVPAIADPCDQRGADVAYARVCETARLLLARSPAADAPQPLSHPLLRMGLGLAAPQRDADGQPLASSRWLLAQQVALAALDPAAQAQARPRLWRELLARAVAEQSPAPPASADADADEAGCLRLARLHGVHLRHDADGWQVTVAEIELGVRDVLLPTALLQALLLHEPAAAWPASGPVPLPADAARQGGQLTLRFSQPLAAASVTVAAFEVAGFDPDAGWQPLGLDAVAYESDPDDGPTVRLTLAAPPSQDLLCVTVRGSGSTPLLGASLVAAGARWPGDPGRDVSITIAGG